MKSSTKSEPDPKQRSIYRCRHDAQENQFAMGTEGVKVVQAAPTVVTGGPGRPRAPKKKPFGGSVPPVATAVVAAPTRQERMAVMREREKEVTNLALRANGGQHQFIPPAYDDPVHDRALAPPFERSLALIPQIEPVLRPSNWDSNSFDPNLSIYSQPYSPYTPDPRRQASYTPDGEIDLPRRYSKQSGRPLPLYYEPPRTVKLPPSPPERLPQWTAFFQQLDQELVFLAPMMASPALGVSPASFFEEDEEMRNMLMDSLEIGEWYKIKFKGKMNKNGKKVWEGIKGMDFTPMVEVQEMDTSGDGMKGKGRRPLTMDTTPIPIPPPPPNPFPDSGVPTTSGSSKPRTRLPHELLGPEDVLEQRDKSQSVS